MINRKKQSFVDDGRTIANMDLEGMPRRSCFPRLLENQANLEEMEELKITSKERRAMFWGALSAVFPIAAAFGALYFIALLLLDILWLH